MKVTTSSHRPMQQVVAGVTTDVATTPTEGVVAMDHKAMAMGTDPTHPSVNLSHSMVLDPVTSHTAKFARRKDMEHQDTDIDMKKVLTRITTVDLQGLQLLLDLCLKPIVLDLLKAQEVY